MEGRIWFDYWTGSDRLDFESNHLLVSRFISLSLLDLISSILAAPGV